MKKFFYSVLFVTVAAFSLSACMEEPIKPADGPGGDPDACQLDPTKCKG